MRTREKHNRARDFPVKVSLTFKPAAHITASLPSAVTVRNPTKDFGKLRAIDDLSFEVAKGEIFGFLGPNGAGKTTSISIMTGLVNATSGTTELLGKTTLAGGDSAARALIGVAPQETVLWDTLTSAENLAFMGEMCGVPRAEAQRKAAARERQRLRQKR